jgi:uncharacterized membrane protein YoaT (DUF817 family)
LEPLKEIIVFCVKQLRPLIFSVIFFVLLIASHAFQIKGLNRYDPLFFGAIAAQLVLLWTWGETLYEVKVIAVFHLIGLLLELFKTQPGIGSWAYPEPSLFRISTVPLYSGFMYATVASYLCQAWRLFDVILRQYPPYWLSGAHRI